MQRLSFALLIVLIQFSSVSEQMQKLELLPVESAHLDVVRSQFGSSLNKAPIMYSQKQNLWYVQVGVGHPPQLLNILIDTGSSQVWIFSSQSTTCGQNKKFQSAESQSFIAYNMKAEIKYYSLELYGKYAKDYLTLENIDVFSKIGVASVCKKLLLHSDGIMGLGNQRIIDNIFDLAYRAGQIKSSKYALQISPKGHSYMYYNISEQDLPDAVYANSIKDSWGIFVSKLSFGSLALYNLQISFDSGSDGIYFSEDFFTQFKEKYFSDCYREPPKKSTYYCKCENLHEYPNITIETRKIKLILNSTVYLKRISEIQCELDALSISTGQVIIGQQFFSSYSIIFDKANQQLGFFKPRSSIKQQQSVKNETIQTQNKQYFSDTSIHNTIIIISTVLILVTILMILHIVTSAKNRNLRVRLALQNYIVNFESISNDNKQLQQMPKVTKTEMISPDEPQQNS